VLYIICDEMQEAKSEILPLAFHHKLCTTQFIKACNKGFYWIDFLNIPVQGKLKPKCGPFPFLTVHPDLPVMALNDFVGDI